MRVTPESFTVIPDPMQGEISLLVAGLTIVLDIEEARELARQLLSGMQKLSRADRAPDRIVRSSERPAPTPPERMAAEPELDKAPKSSVGDSKGAAEEPLLLSSQAALSGQSADAVPADKRERKRLRSFLKVLGKEDDGAVAGNG
jgi:hypothetical protein